MHPSQLKPELLHLRFPIDTPRKNPSAQSLFIDEFHVLPTGLMKPPQDMNHAPDASHSQPALTQLAHSRKPMQCSQFFLNRLHAETPRAETIVVIDVLRSFTSAAIALGRGARAVYPVESVSTAGQLARTLPRAVSVGAVGGGDPIPGFDFGNSPQSLNTADLKGKRVVLSTAAGVRGLQRFHEARYLYAASLLCARATAEAIRASGSRQICFVITGEWIDRDGDEDVACADYIQALLENRAPDTAAFAERVRQSDFGRRFLSGEWPNLPLTDLNLATQVDCYDFAMPVGKRGGHLIMRAVRPRKASNR